MHGQSIDFMIATLITSIIISKFGLNMTYYGIIFGLITYIASQYEHIFSYALQFQYYTYILTVLITISILYGLSHIYKYIINRKIFEIVIKDDNIMKIYNKYINIFPDIITDNYSITEGIIDDGLLSGEQRVKNTSYFTNKNVKFYDYNFGVKGYINWILDNKKIQTVLKNDNSATTTKEYIYVYLTITVTNIESDKINNGKDYLDNFTDLCQLKVKENGELLYSKSFKMYKYYQDSKYDGESYKKESGFLSQSKDSCEELEKKYINSFFSSAKNIVWKKIKKIHFEPEFFINISQQPRANFIFYGPPGTGKSSFVTRMAITLKRHLISLDLRDFIDKSSIYREILSPRIPTCPTALKQKDVIFILDEFDLLIDELSEQEKMERIVTTKDEKIELSIREKAKFLRDFTLYDLVEFFQGSIPCDGLVMIAITNDFERIQQKCPKLFRDGRLTPVKFDHINYDAFDELCNHYFGKSFDTKFNDTIDVPISSIIDKAINCKLSSDDNNHNFNCFKEEINKLIFTQNKN